MNKYSSRLLVTTIAFVVSWTVVSLRRSIEHALKWKQSRVQIHGEVYPAVPIPIPLPEDFGKLRDLSPYDIEIFINHHPQANLAEIWRRLGIRELTFAEGWEGQTSPSEFLAACVDCNAATFEYDLDDENGSEVLLRIEDRPAERCRYLIFKSPHRSSSWKLIGHIDHDFGRYSMPKHLILLSDGRPWLVINQQGQSGSGVSLYFDRLFLVDRGVLKEVMRYPSEGHRSSFTTEPERNFRGRLLNAQMKNGIARIEIEFVVTYLIEDLSGRAQDHALFTKRQRAFFIRQLNQKMFTLDPAHSDLSQNELEAVYDIDSLTNEGFLKYNFEELSRLATGTDANRKKWLKQFLNVCKESKEKHLLHVLLTGNNGVE